MSPYTFNFTPFATQCFLLTDPEGQLFLSAVVCANFEIHEDGSAHPSEGQDPVPTGDEFFGKPGHSAVRRDSGAHGTKPLVDLVLEANAYAPSGRAVSEMLVGVRIGHWSKLLSVCGDREWSGVAHDRPSPPRPFVSMPIRYEFAYGGALYDEQGRMTACHPANPIGVGYASAVFAAANRYTELPNIESPKQRLVRRDETCPVAGFGAIARNWEPRVCFAGRYDANWLASRSPMLPADFDKRFHQCAPPDQQLPSFPAGEDVVLRNLTHDGHWRFRMPILNVPISILGEERCHSAQLEVDTIIVDAERRRVSVIARHCLHHLRTMGLVREVVFGTPTAGWLRALTRGKKYLGRTTPVGGG
ncbi:MAG: DUF2169 domain-containing protein [Nitrospira sp.]|nr:DUF2169 domain-containing protein [Nitrospira sp.]